VNSAEVTPHHHKKVTLQHLYIEGHAADTFDGGALKIYVQEPGLEIEIKDVNFNGSYTGGMGEGFGGSIDVEPGSYDKPFPLKFTVDGCYFSSSANSGGALFFSIYGTAVVKNSVFEGCYTMDGDVNKCGGAISGLASGGTLVQNCTFRDNIAGLGDTYPYDSMGLGGAICSGGDLTVVGSTFINNAAWPTKPLSQKPYFNASILGVGGAIGLLRGANLKMKGNYFSGNLPNDVEICTPEKWNSC